MILVVIMIVVIILVLNILFVVIVISMEDYQQHRQGLADASQRLAMALQVRVIYWKCTNMN